MNLYLFPDVPLCSLMFPDVPSCTVVFYYKHLNVKTTYILLFVYDSVFITMTCFLCTTYLVIVLQSVIGNSTICDSFTLNNLPSMFCLYGVVLFNLHISCMLDRSYRKVVRHVFRTLVHITQLFLNYRPI